MTSVRRRLIKLEAIVREDKKDPWNDYCAQVEAVSKAANAKLSEADRESLAKRTPPISEQERQACGEAWDRWLRAVDEAKRELNYPNVDSDLYAWL